MAQTLINESWNVGNYSGSSNNAYTFRLEVILNSQSVETNKSNITVNKYIKGINGWSWYGYNSKDDFTGAVTDSITYNPPSMTPGTEYKIHYVENVDLAHNSDGTLSVTLGNTFTPTGKYSSMPKSNTKSVDITLPTIARASNISLASNNVTINSTSGSLGYTITPYSSSFTHTIVWTLGTGGDTIPNASSGSFSYSTLLAALNNNTSGTLTVTLITYSSGTEIGRKTVTATVAIGSSIAPTLSLGNIGIESTGASSLTGYLIAGRSKANMTSTAGLPSGASSVNTVFTTSHGQVTPTSTTSTSSVTVKTDVLPSSTSNYTLTMSATVTDSRGKTASASKTRTVYGYKAPTVSLSAYRVATSTSTTRDDGGSYVYVTFGGALGATVNGQNSIQSTSCTYSGSISGTATNGQHLALSDSQTVTFVCTVADKVTSSSLSVTVSNATFSLDICDDKAGHVGASIGGVARYGYFDSHLPSVFDHQLFTSFQNSVAMGSYGTAQQTVDGFVNEVRFSSGCMGSISIGTAYTHSGVTIPTGWYNFIYSPHRSGGSSGAASGDNCNYGNLLLMGMTVTSGIFRVRINSGSITQVTKLAEGSSGGGGSDYYGTCSTAAATAAKTASITDFPTTLTAGLKVTIRFTNANGVANPTLSINNGTAIAIKRYGTTAPGTSAGTSWNAGTTVQMTYDGTYWLIDNWLNTTYSTITEANIKNSSYTSGTLITGQRFYQAYTYYSAYTQLFSGTLNSSTTSNTFDSSDYTAFLIVGAEGRGYRSSITVPRALITTTAQQWMITFYGASSIENVRFTLKASAATGGTITITWQSGKSITQIYGIR